MRKSFRRISQITRIVQPRIPMAQVNTDFLDHEEHERHEELQEIIAAEVFSYRMYIVLLINQKDYEHFNERWRETVRL